MHYGKPKGVKGVKGPANAGDAAEEEVKGVGSRKPLSRKAK
jgi:hypothetical protein